MEVVAESPLTGNEGFCKTVDNYGTENAGKTVSVPSLEHTENLTDFLLFTCIFSPPVCHD